MAITAGVGPTRDSTSAVVPRPPMRNAAPGYLRRNATGTVIESTNGAWCQWPVPSTTGRPVSSTANARVLSTSTGWRRSHA